MSGRDQAASGGTANGGAERTFAANGGTEGTFAGDGGAFAGDGMGGRRPGVGRGRRAVTLAAVLLGFLTLPMLMSGTTVALPRIGTDLAASGAALQWVVVGYFLAAAAMMLVAGSLGDLFGRRRVFAAGAVVYTAGALISAFAADILTLNAARTLSGIGAAGVMSGGGAVLGATFTGQARTRAYAAMGTTAGVGLAIGPTLAGWLVGTLGWRATFAFFAGAGLLMLAGTTFMTNSRAVSTTTSGPAQTGGGHGSTAGGRGLTGGGERLDGRRGVADREPRLDVAGALTLIAALTLTMFGVNQAAEAGWASGRVLIPLTAGLTMLVAFVLIERRSRNPVLHLALLRDRRFVAWTLAGLFLAAAPAGITAYLPTYLQGAAGVPVQETGLTMLMLTTPVLLLPQAGGLLINRGLPPRVLATLSLALMAAGTAWLTTLHPTMGALALLGPLAVIGTGMGLMIGTTDAQAVNQVTQDRIGMATGLLNTVRAGGGTLATTLFGTTLATALHTRTPDAARIVTGNLSEPARALEAAWLTEAWRTALWPTAALCAIAALLVWWLLTERDTAERAGPWSAPHDRDRLQA